MFCWFVYLGFAIFLHIVTESALICIVNTTSQQKYFNMYITLFYGINAQAHNHNHASPPGFSKIVGYSGLKCCDVSPRHVSLKGFLLFIKPYCTIRSILYDFLSKFFCDLFIGLILFWGCVSAKNKQEIMIEFGS